MTMGFESEASAESVISRLAEPGEHILWTGRPNSEAMLGRHAGRFWIQVALTSVLIGGTAWLAARTFRAPALEPALLDALLDARFLVPAAVVLIVIPVLFVVLRKRFVRYVHSLTYGMTDRRLLVVERNEIVDEYRPEQLGRVHIRRRTRGFGDVNLGRRSTARAGARGSRDAVQREREYVGFKALPDAEAMQATIEKWIAFHQSRAESASADFLEAVKETAGPRDVERNDIERNDDVPDDAVRRVSHHALGLRIEFPESWRIRVRAKKKPNGRMFFDSVRWQESDEAGDWNVVLGEGPMHCSVEVEVFEIAPTASYESLSSNRLATAVKGSLVDAEPVVEIKTLSGFRVTRRKEIEVGEGGVATLAAVVTLERETVLHDGRRQVWIKSTWPESSEALGHVVDRIVRSTRLDHMGRSTATSDRQK
jgi:hypothetical protein